MILYDAIPGQETGNVDYVVENNAGVFAPNSRAVADSVQQWLSEGHKGLERRSRNARRLGRPNAVWDIADEVWEHAHKPMIANNRRNLLKEFAAESKRLITTI
jgi:1,2-diacylglycerol 3-beta-galactosyltransferase